MRRQDAIGVWGAVLLLAAALCAGGCGGGDEAPAENRTQDALVPAGADTAAAATDSIPGADVADPLFEQSGETGGAPEPREKVGAAPTVVVGDDPAPKAAMQAEAAVAEAGPAPNVVLPPAGQNSAYSVQLGSFQIRSYAETQADRVRSAGYEPVIEMADVAGVTWHRVLVRGIADRAAAEAVGEDLRSRLDVNYLIKRAE